MNPGSQVNHPIRGSLWRWRSSHSTVKSGSGRQLTPATRGGNRCETTKTNPTRTGPAEELPTPLLIRRFTLRSSGQRCIRGCASWPGSSHAHTWGVRRNGAAHQRPARRRQVNPASNPPGNRRTADASAVRRNSLRPPPCAAMSPQTPIPQGDARPLPPYHETVSNVMPCKALRASNFSWTMDC